MLASRVRSSQSVGGRCRINESTCVRCALDVATCSSYFKYVEVQTYTLVPGRLISVTRTDMWCSGTVVAVAQ